MDGWNLTLTLSSLRLLLLLSIWASTVTATSSHVTINPFEDIVCKLIDCGQGTCRASNNSLLGFDCECNPGWREIQIGPLTFPSCLIPNCTVDFQCGDGSPSSSSLAPPPASLSPPANQTSHCDLVWCGDGKCVNNGTGHICQCNQGSVNLFNSFGLPCFKPCYFGADCEGLGLDLPMRHPQPPPPPPLPPSSSSNRNGFNSKSKCLGTLLRLSMLALAATCLQGFS